MSLLWRRIQISEGGIDKNSSLLLSQRFSSMIPLIRKKKKQQQQTMRQEKLQVKIK